MFLKIKHIIKFYLNLFLRFFNLEIVSKDRQKINYSFDFDYQKKFNALDKIIVFDVGANKGQSINRFRSIFKNSIIHSFEPDEKCFKLLKKNYINDKNVYLNDFALSNKKESKKFYSYGNSTDNSFHKKKDDKIIKSSTVHTETLDEYIDKNNIQKIDILKIDTQAFNKEVIEGAKISLQNKIIDVVEIEMNFGSYYEKVNNFLEIENFLSKYKLAGINKAGSILDNDKFYLDVYYLKS